MAQHNFQTRGAFFDILCAGAPILRLWCTHRTGKRTSDARPCTERTGKRRDRSRPDPTSRPGRLTYTTRTLRWSLSGSSPVRTRERTKSLVGRNHDLGCDGLASLASEQTDGRTADGGRRPVVAGRRPAGHHFIISSFHQFIISCYHHFVTSSFHQIIISCFRQIILSSYHHIIISSYHYFIISAYHHIVISSHRAA